MIQVNFIFAIALLFFLVLSCMITSTGVAQVLADTHSKHTKDVQSDLVRVQPAIWDMDKDAIEAFCIDELKKKHSQTEEVEKNIKKIIVDLMAQLSKDKAEILILQQDTWESERKKRADSYFFAEEHLSEEDQADTHATCYPQRSLNRASYDFITAKYRYRYLEFLQQNYTKNEVNKKTQPQVEIDNFIGVYGTLYLPVGYSLLEVIYNEKDDQQSYPARLIIQSEATLSSQSDMSCEVNMLGRYKDGYLEFIGENNNEFLVQVIWNNDKTGVVTRAVEFNDSTQSYSGDVSLGYCGQGMSFLGEYYSLRIDSEPFVVK